MRHRILELGDTRVWALVFDPGEEVLKPLADFAVREGLEAARIEGIGAFSSVTLGYFELDKKAYRHNRIDEQVEVVSLLGNVAMAEGGPMIHAHVVVANREGRAFGGHLLEGWVEPTLELVVTNEPAYLRRVLDPRTGLALLRP
jgi:hypothetical protein